MRGLSLILLMCWTSLFAGAQQRPDTTSLSPVVITATKTPLPAGASTAATTVIRAEDLEARGIVTAADALRIVPGITVNVTGGPGSQTALFVRGGNSNFTKVLVDGVPVNLPGGALDLSSVSIDNIDRIEVVRGPASVQYGSDAVTGVIQIFTRRGGRSSLGVRAADRDAAGDATLELGRDHVRSTGTRIHASVGGGYHRSDGFLPFNNEYHNADVSALAGVEGVRGEASLASTLVDSRFHYPTTGSGVPTDSNAWTGARRSTLSLRGTWKFLAYSGVRANLGSARTTSLSDNQPDGPADTLGFYSHSSSVAQRDVADVQLFATPVRSTRLSVGVTGERQRVNSSGASVLGRIPLPDSRFDESRTNRGAYVQVGVGERPFSLDAGVRRDRFGSGRGATTGRVGVASEILAGSVIRASLGTAFKEPALDELFATSFSAGNPELRPERSRSREIGAETRLPRVPLTLGATVFDQRFGDLVQYQFRGPGLPDFYNIVAARARGLELEARMREFAGVGMRGTYTFLHSEVTEPGDGGFGTLTRGLPLVRRPRRAGTLDAAWQRRRVGVNAIITRVGARDDVDFGRFPAARVRLPAYSRIDLAARLTLLRGGGEQRRPDLTASVRVENAGNARFQNVFGYATPRRIAYLGLRASR